MKALNRVLICINVLLIGLQFINSENSFIQLLIMVLNLILVLGLFQMLILTQVCNFLMSLLAIQKFCLYFYPSTKPRINSLMKQVNKIALLSIFLFFIEKVAYTLVYSLLTPGIISKPQMQFLLAMTTFVPIWFLIAISILYIPIMISKYILAQTLIVMLFKPVYFEVFIEYFLNPNFSLFRASGTPKFIDIVSTPIIIQLSYIFSNKRNVNTLCSSFKFIKLMKYVYNGRTNSVAPNQPVYSITEPPQNLNNR
nr:hypothetical protein F46B3.12 - Caenorhabditis elegans [Caenorhabditis elegans]